jgi:hypothetical protein
VTCCPPLPPRAISETLKTEYYSGKHLLVSKERESAICLFTLDVLFLQDDSLSYQRKVLEMTFDDGKPGVDNNSSFDEDAKP